MVNEEGPWHVSAGTWGWVRDMYGISMHLTGAELDRDVHLQIFDQALAIRDRKLIEQERAELLEQLAWIADRSGGLLTADVLRVLADLLRKGLDLPLPDESPAVPPPTEAGSESV